MMHNLAPHVHEFDESGQSSATFFVKNDLVKEILEFVFKSDIGTDHLENIQIEKEEIKPFKDKSQILNICSNIESLVYVIQPNRYLEKSDLLDIFDSGDFNLCIHKRGPPVC